MEISSTTCQVTWFSYPVNDTNDRRLVTNTDKTGPGWNQVHRSWKKLIFKAKSVGKLWEWGVQGEWQASSTIVTSKKKLIIFADHVTKSQLVTQVSNTSSIFDHHHPHQFYTPKFHLILCAVHPLQLSGSSLYCRSERGRPSGSTSSSAFKFMSVSDMRHSSSTPRATVAACYLIPGLY